jgi:PKD repeat protein
VEEEPITEIPPDGAVITLTTGNALLQPTKDFTVTLGEGSEPITFVWDFGDGSPIYTGPVASHVYAPGVYTATLTATNSAGTVTTTIVVFVPWRILLSIMVKDSTLPLWLQGR